MPHAGDFISEHVPPTDAFTADSENPKKKPVYTSSCPTCGLFGDDDKPTMFFPRRDNCRVTIVPANNNRTVYMSGAESAARTRCAPLSCLHYQRRTIVIGFFSFFFFTSADHTREPPPPETSRVSFAISRPGRGRPRNGGAGRTRTISESIRIYCGGRAPKSIEQAENLKISEQIVDKS